MPWPSFIPWSNSLKTRACRQLIHHYLGVFFQEKLSLDQLSVDLFSGRGQVKDVILNLNALNESLTNNNIPFEVVKAYVGEINLLIPWTSLLRDNSLLDIKDLEITIRPKHTNDQNMSDASFELSTMFNSMNTSMLIAQECLKNETEEDTTYQGLETFAATIDSILARVRVTLTDTVIRLEHLINNSDHGVALEIRIKKFEYFDSEATSIDMTVPLDANSLIRPTVFTNKNFVLSGVTLYTDEFSIYKNSSSMTESLSNRLIADSMMSSVLTNSTSALSSGYTRMVGYETFDPILCLTISGKQDIRLKLKQSEQIFGPKVEIEAHCGSVNCLLTPKQLQSLIILLTAYQKAALSSTSDTNLYNTTVVNNRPMTDDDFKRIEQNLAEEIRRKNCQIGAQQYDHDYYHFSDIDNAAPEPSESMFCSVKGMSTSIDLESSYTSSRPDSLSTTTHHRSLPHHHSSSNQSLTDKSHLKDATKRLLEQNQSIINTKCRLQFNFISLCLLHRDIQTNSQTLKEFSDSYFSTISTINTSGILDDKQINEHRIKYSQACLKDHLSLLGKPLIIDFIQQSAENCLYLDLDIRFSSVDLCECLQKENTNIQQKPEYPMIFNRLLSFVRVNETNFDSLSSFQIPFNGIQSSIQISITNFDINQTKKKKFSSVFSRRLATLRPFNDINIRLSSCQIDFDISIIDRIYALINACQINNSSTVNKNSNESLTMLTISSPNCNLNLRFPIADLQALNKRRPWWIQGVHKDILTFDLKQVHFQSDFDNEQSIILTITSESIQVYYMMNENLNDRFHIAQLSSSNGEIIKLIVNLNDLKDFLINQLNPPMTETLFDSIFSRLPINNNKLPLKTKTTLNNNRQILEVADDETIKKFLYSCSQETKINLQIIIPYILFYIPDQIFLETIYNRFVNNLFMWESSVPINNDNSNQLFSTTNNFNQQLINSFGNLSSEKNPEQNFQMCRSIINRSNDQSSDDDQVLSDDDDDDDDDQGGITPKISKRKGPNSFVLQLNVQNIHLVANAPSGDKTPKESRTNSTNIGEFRIDGQGLTLAIVDGYQGDPNLQYFCLLSHSALIYHNGHGTVMKSNATLNEVVSRSLPELITRLPIDVFPKYNNNGTMVRAAFEIRTNGDRIEGKQKMIRGSFTIEGAMLHQKIVPKAESWLLQLIELFDLTDEEVPGYIPSTSLVDWHLEFRHCAIHYRPLYFDTKCFVAIDSFALTNTFVKNSKTTLLELNLDDWAIYLSKQKRDRYQIDLLNDYICIISGGAFEIKLCFNDLIENSPMNDPLINISIACNMIHIRSCSDSANALIELLKYVLTDGDLQQQQQTNEISRSSTPIERKRIDRPVRMLNDEIINNEQLTPDDASNQMLLLEEAMKEEHHQPINTSMRKFNNEDDDDDENAIENSHSSDIECGSVFASSTYSRDDDSPILNKRKTTYSGDNNRDFELIEREIGMCRPPENGLCEVHVLTETPIQIHENHFSKPLERNDILNSPSHLPIPTLRFSIRQISVVWHIYGGSDFAIPKPNDSHQQPIQLNINEPIRFNAVAASSPTQERAGGRLYSPYDTTRLARHERGGPCRDLRTSMEFSISKARCQYETYNEEEKISSRFVFAIHEFEIRDRLLTRSEINKFLYLYTTEAVPRRTHADMLVLKILNTKPEGYMMKTPNEEFENGINPNTSSEPLECEIKVSLQPLRINIDQDTLVFMRNFFVNLTNSSTNRETSAPIPVNEQMSTNLTNDYPSSSSFESDLSSSPLSRYPSSPILNQPTILTNIDSSPPPPPSPTTNSSVFIKHFVFSPACHIRIDYHGKLRNEQLFESGPFLNLLIGLAQLAKVDIYLKRISYKRGLLGYEKLLTFLLNEWLNDIRPTDVIKGIVPLSSISQIILGIKDLFYLPIDQYRRDGRVLRGIQRGASAFTTSTALALIELSSQVVRCAHFAALLCFELVSSSTHTSSNLPITSSSSSSSTQQIMVRNHPPPNDIREGVTYAFNVIRQNFNTTSHQLRTEAQLGRRRKGVLGIVGGLLRQMPSVAIQPIVTTTKAAENFLVGMRNQIDRDERNDDKEKYRSE